MRVGEWGDGGGENEHEQTQTPADTQWREETTAAAAAATATATTTRAPLVCCSHPPATAAGDVDDGRNDQGHQCAHVQYENAQGDVGRVTHAVKHKDCKEAEHGNGCAHLGRGTGRVGCGHHTHTRT